MTDTFNLLDGPIVVTDVGEDSFNVPGEGGMVAGLASVTVVQYAPTSTVAANNWRTNAQSTTLHPAIDETTPDEQDYIVSPLNPTGESCTLGFSIPGPPAVNTNGRVGYVASGVGNCPLGFELLETTTVKDTWTEIITPTPTLYWHALSEAVVASISNFANVRVRPTAG